MNNFKKSFLVVSLLVVFGLCLYGQQVQAQDLTREELINQIKVLLAKIEELKKQLVEREAKETWCYDFNVNLKIGDSGSKVAALQTALQKQGLLTEINQEFDEQTASAVSAFQERYRSEILTPLGLRYPTGFVGPATRAKLNKLYGCVVSPNLSPVIDGVSGPTSLKVNETGTWTVKATDPEGGYLTYSVDWGDGTDKADQGLRASAKITQTATFTHSYSKTGIYTPTFTVADDKGLSAKTSISVNVGDVTQPSITVLSPNGGESWEIGKTYEIKFTPAVTFRQASILLSLVDLNKNFVKWITTIMPNETSYKWTISADISPGQYYVKAQKFENEGGIDYSDAPFSIVAATTTSSITVLSPNGGESWEIGKTYEIKWKSSNLESVNIYLEKWGTAGGGLYAGGPLTWLIAQNVSAANSSYFWTIPSNITPYITVGSLYKIRVVKTGDTSPYSQQIADSSDDYFSIVAAGEKVTCNSCSDCTSKLTGNYKRVELITDINNYSGRCIEFSGSNIEFDCLGYTIDGTKPDWTTFPLSVGISVGGNNNVIKNCTVKEFYHGIYLSGTSGNKLENNKTVYNTQHGIVLDYAKNTTLTNNQSCGNSGYDIDAIYTEGGSGTIDIEKWNNKGFQNRCEKTFYWNDIGKSGCSLGCHPAAVSVLSPNGGESWEAGKTYTITWLSRNVSSDQEVSINVLGNTGAIGIVERSIKNTGSFNWTIPKSFTPGNYTIQVIVFLSDGRTLSDTSDAAFSIIAPTTTPSSAVVKSIQPYDMAECGFSYYCRGSVKNVVDNDFNTSWYPAAFKANVLIEYENLIDSGAKIEFKWSGDGYDPNCAGNIYVSEDKINWTKIVDNKSAKETQAAYASIPFRYLKTEFPSPSYVSSVYGQGRCGWVSLSEIQVKKSEGLGIMLNPKYQMASVADVAEKLINSIKELLKRK